MTEEAGPTFIILTALVSPGLDGYTHWWSYSGVAIITTDTINVPQAVVSCLLADADALDALL